MAVSYSHQLQALLAPLLAEGKTVSTADLFSSPSLGSATIDTKLRHLKKFISERPEYIGTVHGVLPSQETILGVVAQQLGGAICETNVSKANELCSAIVTKVAEPLVRSYIETSLHQYVSGGQLTLPIDALIEFLVGDFATFSRSAGNGLVSVAGGLNEALLRACLRHAGLLEGVGFTRTGTDSDGDIVIHCQSGLKPNLGVEVKSYHARERLLRGLNDIKGLKVGAGFFVDASEFGIRRTKALLQTGAAAIYMPQSTLSCVVEEALNLRTNEPIAFQRRLYRPLEQFASDMKSFASSGTLPNY